MTPHHSSGALRRRSPDLLAYATDGGRRSAFLVVSVVLAAAMAFSVDPGRDLSGGRLLAVIGALALLLGTIAMAGWSNEVVFDREGGVVRFDRRLFGRTLPGGETTPIGQVGAVVLQRVRLLDPRRTPNRRWSQLGSVLEVRSRLCRLLLRTEERDVRLDDGNSPEELLGSAAGIAEFLGVPLEQEDL